MIFPLALLGATLFLSYLLRPRPGIDWSRIPVERYDGQKLDDSNPYKVP